MSISRLARLKAWGRTWLRLHGYALFSSLGSLWRNPWMALVTLLVIAVTLALPLTFYLTLKNLQVLSSGIGESWRVSLYLQPQLEEKAVRQLAQQLRQHQAVAEVRLIDKRAALAEFRRYSGFGEVLDALPENPLPAVIELIPREPWADPDHLASLVKEWERLEEVDFAQWDMRWLQRLRAWLRLAERGAVLIGVFLSLAVLLVVGNTIRLELENRREEIEVMKLLGATHRFIRRPFLYSGFWYGFGGGLLAWVLVLGLYLVLRPQVDHVAELYGNAFSLCFASLGEIGAFWGFAVLLGMAGAWLVVTRHLWRLDF